MNQESVMTLAHQAMYVGLLLAAPLLLVALVVGLVVSLFQAATQINETTLSFIPKLLATAPVLGNRSLPTRVKIGLAAFITIIVAPTLGALPQVTVFSAEGVWIIVNQFLIGIALGMTMQIVFQAISATGDFVGLGMGLGFATFFDAQASSSSQVLSSYMNTIAMLVFLVIDGHLQMISALLTTFQSVPVSANILGAPG